MKNVEKIGGTGIFTRFIYKALPLAFDESLSYYECLCALLDYLQNTIMPALNNNAEALIELQNLFVELKNYVDNYFENLDIQTEINNKLDEMAESGQLADIIAQYLEVASVLGFDTKADLKAGTTFANGSIARTIGTDNYNDGKGNYYKIRTYTTDDTIDDENILELNNYPTLIAEKINNINVKPIKNITLGCFHKNYGSSNKKSYLFLSTDNYNFSKIPNIEIENANGIFSDPFITWDKNNKQFIISSDNQQDGKTCTIATSKDLIHYNYFDITLNYPITVGNNKYCPSLLWDNNTLYLIISVNESGYTVGNWHTMIAECTDIETMTFGNATEITHSGESDLYDISIFKFNNKYYMSGANQNTGHVELYESTTLNNFNQINENLFEMAGGNSVCEGCRLTNINNKLVAVCELHNDNIIATCEMTIPGTVDRQRTIPSLYAYKVGNFINLNDINALNIIQNLTFIYNNDTNYNTDTKLNILTLTENTTLDELTIVPNKILVINGNYNLTIKNILDPFNVKKLPLIINSKNIDITIQKYNNETVYNRTYYFRNNIEHYNFRVLDFNYYTTCEFNDNYLNRWNFFSLEPNNNKFTLFNQQAWEVNKVKTINVYLKATATSCDNVKILNYIDEITPIIDTLIPLYNASGNIVGSAKITSSGVTVKADNLIVGDIYFINGTYI